MKRIFPFLIFGLAALACSLFSPAVSTPTGQPTLAIQEAPMGPPPTPLPGLTVDQLKNSKVKLVFRDSHPTVQLTNGLYQNGTDPASADYASVNLLPQIAYGDLNGDGASDAAILIAENYGGTGVFVSVIAMLNQNGQPMQAASEMIDDRPQINSLSIQNGQIFLDAVIHGSNDPGCCAAWPTKRTFRYEFNKLVMTSFSSGTPDGSERLIAITQPSNGDQVMLSQPLTVTGNVTIAPFENNLVYSIFDSNNNQVANGSLLVQASQPGGPGSFSLPVDLSKITSPGPVRIQIEDKSPADGSILALGSVTISVIK
ncbi:MAG: hypothetical protein M1282_18570 [Chloroflexi bacterium]|nr:hypothetical protein [Chloroflexota bacterium]